MFAIDGPHIQWKLTSFSSMAILINGENDDWCLLIDDSMVSVMMVMLMFWWIWWVYWWIECRFMMNMRIDVCRLMYSAFTEVFIQRQHTQCPSLCLMEGEPHYICFRYVFVLNIFLYLYFIFVLRLWLSVLNVAHYV